MADTLDEDSVGMDDTVDLPIEDAVEEVEQIVTDLEEGDIDLPEAKNLRDRAIVLLDHIESELEVGDGDVDRVDSV